MIDSNGHKCPKCKTYILGDFCYICNININDYQREDIPDCIRDIFDNFRDGKFKNE